MAKYIHRMYYHLADFYILANDNNMNKIQFARISPGGADMVVNPPQTILLNSICLTRKLNWQVTPLLLGTNKRYYPKA
jgi:hypothetical protein